MYTFFLTQRRNVTDGRTDRIIGRTIAHCKLAHADAYYKVLKRRSQSLLCMMNDLLYDLFIDLCLYYTMSLFAC